MFFRQDESVSLALIAVVMLSEAKAFAV